MTIQEAIARIDDLKPNQYKYPNKIEWINEIDGRIYREVISKYVAENEDEAITYDGYSEESDPSLILIIDEPYSMAYVYYMSAQIDFWNGEFTRYNNSMTRFEEMYQGFAEDYAKKHKHNLPNKFRLG